MIIRENVTINERPFVYTYSDLNVKISRNGKIYDTVYDPAEYAEERVYTETDIPIQVAENEG